MQIKFLITGDYCPTGRNSEKLKKEDFSFFGEIEKYIQSSELAITNLESPVTNSDNRIIKTGPNIKVDSNAVLALKKVGFHLVTMSNNHILDYGVQGLNDTIEELKKNQLDYVGAGVNLETARKSFIKTFDSVKIGILNFAENEFGSADNSSGGANPVNPITNFYDIQETKKQVDFLIVIAHGGREHYQLPTPKQRERYRFYVDCGADLVVGHHAHCYSGYENYNEKLIFYSLGNFIFDYKEKYQKGMWTEGYAVSFTLKDKDIDFELIPYFQGRKENPDLVLFNSSEKNDFLKRIEELNNIISNDELFESAWKNYIASQKKTYKGMLLLQNDYIREAVRRGLIPDVSFHSKKHQLLLLNLLRCETHNEIMTKVLEDELLNLG